MSQRNPIGVGTGCSLGFSPGGVWRWDVAPGGDVALGKGIQLGLDTGCALCGSASCWQETARAVGAATWRAGADTPASNLGGATAGREAAASPRLDLPFGGSETCSSTN